MLFQCTLFTKQVSVNNVRMVEPRWEFFPLLAEQEEPRKWLQIQADLSLAENTIQAYGKSLEDYLLFCIKMQLPGSSHEANQQLLDHINSLELEKQKLIKDREQTDQLKINLVLAQQKLCEYEKAKDSSKAKLIVLEQKKLNSITSDSILDTIKPRLKDIGVRLNKKLAELIESLEKEQVQNAVSAVEEYLATGKKVKSKAGLLRKALEESWTPNLTDEERVINQTKDTFSQWYKLAKEEGIVQASQGTKKGILVLEPTGEWTPFEAMLEKGWTLEYLEERARR